MTQILAPESAVLAVVNKVRYTQRLWNHDLEAMLRPMSVLTMPGHTLLTMTRGLVEVSKPSMTWDRLGSRALFLLAVRPECQFANLLDRVHDQKLADGVVGLRVPEPAWPVVFAAHLSQDAALLLRPPSQLIEVGVEMLARGEEGYIRRRRSLIPGSTHPP